VFENYLSVCACLGFLFTEPSLYFARSLLLAPVLSSHIDQVSSLRAFISILHSWLLLLLCNSPQSSAIRHTTLLEFHIWSPQLGTTSDFFVLLSQLSSLVYLVFIEGIGIGSLGQLVFGYWLLVLGTDIGIGDWIGCSVERILG